MIKFETTIKETQVDMLGHLNNAVYLELFELARWDIIHSRGYGMKKMLELQKGPVLLEVNLKFMREVLTRDVITIKSELVKYEGRVGQILQKMYKEDGVQAAELLVTFGLFDMKTRRLIEPTPEWKAALS
jgi:YbgC/YbaW family acyl-CoA thioester hydrolase